MPFNDRADAGRKLAKALASYKDEQPVLLALPRGGVSVAAEGYCIQGPSRLDPGAQNWRTLSTRAGHGRCCGRRSADHRAQ